MKWSCEFHTKLWWEVKKFIAKECLGTSLDIVVTSIRDYWLSVICTLLIWELHWLILNPFVKRYNWIFWNVTQHLLTYRVTLQSKVILVEWFISTYTNCYVSIHIVLQSLSKEWVDPVVRPTSHSSGLMNLPANRLRQRQREIALEQKQATLKQGRKKTPPKFFSALEVVPQLKRRAQQGWEFSVLIYQSSSLVVFAAIEHSRLYS